MNFQEMRLTHVHVYVQTQQLVFICRWYDMFSVTACRLTKYIYSVVGHDLASFQ